MAWKQAGKGKMNEKQGVTIKLFKHPQNRVIWNVRMEVKSRQQPYLIRAMTSHEGIEEDDILTFINSGIEDQAKGRS